MASSSRRRSARRTSAGSCIGTFAQAWCNRGSARAGKGDWARAAADSTKAIELDPKLAAPWRDRGYERAQTGDLGGAIADYEHFLELAPTDTNAPVVRRLLADAEAKRGH